MDNSMNQDSSTSHWQDFESKSALLGLPLEVRQSIYRAAGVVPCCTMSLNGLPDPGEDGMVPEFEDWSSKRFGSRFVGPCLRGMDIASACAFTWSFMKVLRIALTCRQLANEVMDLIYSEGKFVIHRCANHGLHALHRISRRNLAQIRTLRIELNTTIITHSWASNHPKLPRTAVCRCPCNFAEDFPPPYLYCVCDKPDESLRVGSDQLRQVLNGLEDIISLFQEVVPSYQLDLGIICDVDDKSTAESIAAKLIRLPLLRTCAIRFSVGNRDVLREIARSTAVRLTASKELLRIDFPGEIVWNILESALIAPRDIEWKPTGKRPGFNLHLQHIQRPHFCEQVRGWAHSNCAFASTCKCWRFPLELFMLNRAHNMRCVQTFYKHNHFILLPDRGYTLPGKYEPKFWRHSKAPQYSYTSLIDNPFPIHHLTSLQFVLPMQGTTITTVRSRFPDEPNLGIPLHWYQLLRTIFRQPRKHKLNVVVDFSTLDHKPLRDDPALDSIQAWNQRLVRISRTMQSAMGSNLHTFQSFYIYVPQHLRHKDLESDFERRIMSIDGSQMIGQKYLHANRFEYWYTFVTGRTVENGLFGDLID